MGMKTCSKCGQDKELDAFANEAKRKDGKYPWCRECASIHKKARYKKIPRKVWIEQKVCSKCKEWKPREEFRKYAGNNLHYRCIACEDKEAEYEEAGVCECSACGEVKPLAEYYKSRQTKRSKQCIECIKAYTKQPDVRLHRRDQALQKHFGIDLAQYKELLEKQDYTCPICLKPFEKDNYSYPVDHAHGGPRAGVVRAILHDKCNRFVMADHTDPEILRRAADLMESPLTDWFVPEEFLKGPKKRRRNSRRPPKGTPEYAAHMAERRARRTRRKAKA